jgi:hypothetical protein
MLWAEVNRVLEARTHLHCSIEFALCCCVAELVVGSGVMQAAMGSGWEWCSPCVGARPFKRHEQSVKMHWDQEVWMCAGLSG